MAKTITLRIDDELYMRLKRAAQAEHRSISNYIENAARNFLIEESFVSDEEMADILKNNDFIKNIRASLHDIERGDYRFVE